MKLYEVYEGEYLKFYNLTAEQCANKIGVTRNNIYNASKSGGTVRGRYRIKVSHDSLEAIEDDFVNVKRMPLSYQRDFAKRWNKVCKPFRELSERKNKRRNENGK